ncbi:MAG: DUF4340 domain-containing protein [Planctomycetes bacterium]|nr:DUF4340 domain-containing protein [Planctomycetota bacterium]
MNPARLLLVVLLLGALAGGAWWLAERPPSDAPAPDPAGPAAVGLLGSATDQVESLVIHLPQRPTIIRLRREADRGWRMLEPWLDRADNAAVESVLRSLRLSPVHPFRDDWRGHSDADLGLDPPSFVVEFEMAGGAGHTLLVGAPEPTGQRHAALFDGQRIMLGVADVGVWEREATHWRDSAVFADPAAVSRIEWLPASGDGFALERTGRRWRMAAPEQFLLSPSAEGMVARLLRARAGLIPEEVVDDAVRRELEGADRIVLHRGERGALGYWLKGAYVLAEDRSYPLPVLLDDFRLVFSRREDLRSPFLFDLIPGEIVSLEVEVGGQSHAFRRRAPGWFGPDSALLEPPAQNLLSELVERVCAIRPQRPGLPRPEGEPAGRLIVSRSQQPNARSGGELEWWTRDQGMPLAAAAGAAEATELDFNLDAGVRGILPR